MASLDLWCLDKWENCQVYKEGLFKQRKEEFSL